MRKFGPTNPHGTAFAQTQWLYQKLWVWRAPSDSNGCHSDTHTVSWGIYTDKYQLTSCVQ